MSLDTVVERLRSADLAIFCAFVKKHVEEKEAVQLSFYEERSKLWRSWNDCGRLPRLLSFFLSGFCKGVLHVSLSPLRPATVVASRALVHDSIQQYDTEAVFVTLKPHGVEYM